MSRLKTTVVAALLAIGVSGPARAAEDLYRVFASCSGRFSAEMEHAWLLQSGQGARLEGQRQAALDLLDAVLPEGREREAIRFRVEAKAAHAALLSAASFGQDPERSAWALARSRAQVEHCQRLLIGG